MKESDFLLPLLEGTLEVTGRLVDASNATLFGLIRYQDLEIPVIYKPVAGERPLWDFPSGTLANRERAAFLLSHLAGYELVPATVLRDGPFGIGAVQRWIEVDDARDLIAFGQSADPYLRRMALFDAVINNTDRKFGHILIAQTGEIFGCDHGVTFHEETKLRTVLWQFANSELSESELELLVSTRQVASDDSNLTSLLSPNEVSALHLRIDELLDTRRFPLPSSQWPAIPWPPV